MRNKSCVASTVTSQQCFTACDQTDLCRGQFCLLRKCVSEAPLQGVLLLRVMGVAGEYSITIQLVLSEQTLDV